MDEALYYLLEAQDYINSFVEISLVDSFFEESNESKELNDKNEKSRIGAIEALKKAFRALINTIKDMIDKFGDFFRTKALSSEERERYAEFKKMVKDDPDMAKRKITIDDWKRYEKAYEEALKELDAEAKKSDPRSDVINDIIENLKKNISNLAGDGKDATSRAALSVTLSTAVDIADQNVTMAKAINFALKNELIKLEDIEKSLGHDVVAKFNKKIEAASKNGIIHRAKVMIFKHRDRTFKAIIKKQFKKLLSFTNIKDGKIEQGKSVIDSGSISRGIIKNHDMVVAAAGGKEEANELAKKFAKSAVDVQIQKYKANRTVNKIKKQKKQAEKEFNNLKKFFS